jgi:hypothetical protein
VKEFYAKIRWRFDIDSGTISFGKNVTTAAPGTVTV